jgi:hypothetical protein
MNKILTPRHKFHEHTPRRGKEDNAPLFIAFLITLAAL